MNKKIYFVAPSFGVTTSPYKERFKQALKVIKSLGYEYIIGDNVYKNKGIASSNTPELRAKEIIDAYNSDCDIIWSVGGGEVMIEILDYIDFNLIKNKKDKIFIGFSDNTNLTYTITTITNNQSIYGVNAPSMCLLEYDSLDTIKMLEGKKAFKGYKKWQYEDLDESPIHSYVFDKKTKMKVFNYEKPLEGILIGGCLDVLVGLCGTKFDNTVNYINSHKNDGIIMYFEACDYNSIQLLRSLTTLKYANWFDNVDAFLIGRSNNYYDKSFNLSMNDAYLNVLLPFNKPIIMDIDLGHRSPSIPIKNGAKAKITYNRNNLKFEYE